MRYRIVYAILALGTACSGGTSMNGNSSASKPAKSDAPAPVTEKPVEAEKDPEKEDDDLHVIPPEVVSGAYLICSDTESGIMPAAGKAEHACQAVQADGLTRVELKNYKQTWTIQDIATSQDVPSADVGLPAGSKFDRIFEIAAAAVTRGVKTQLKIEGGSNSTAILKTRGKCVVNGKVVDCGNSGSP